MFCNTKMIQVFIILSPELVFQRETRNGQNISARPENDAELSKSKLNNKHPTSISIMTTE